MLRKHEFYEAAVWPRWLQEVRQSPNRVILLPGIMGSELYDRQDHDTIWVDTGVWHEVDNLAFETLAPDGAVDSQEQFVYARSTVNPPVIGDPYDSVRRALRAGRFSYDWRESIPIEARRLGLFLEKLAADGQPVRFVTHSMGGRLLLALLANDTRFDGLIDQIVFVAPPFHGALKPIRVIEDGDGTPVDWLIRNSVLCESAASLPGLFDLLAAPEGFWPTELPLNGGQAPLQLRYPILDGETLYRTGAWTNRHRPELRPNLLKFAEGYHRDVWSKTSEVSSGLPTRSTSSSPSTARPITLPSAPRAATGSFTRLQSQQRTRSRTATARCSSSRPTGRACHSTVTGPSCRRARATGTWTSSIAPRFTARSRTSSRAGLRPERASCPTPRSSTRSTGRTS